MSALLLAAPARTFAAANQATAPGLLSGYVARPDPSVRWTLRSAGEFRGAEYREYVLVSQTWRGIPWKHQLFLIRPPHVEPDKPALLFIAGGKWRAAYDQPPAEPSTPKRAGVYAALARRLEAPVAVLLQVPFQPLLGGRTEDELIAYTLAQYLRTGEPDWPLLLPMTRAASIAMDAVQATAREAWGLDVQHFVVTGASKRGWTTWLTAATDSRVVAFAPMVFDVLDMRRQMAHQELTWGMPSQEIAAYRDEGLPRLLRTPAGDRLLDLIDPWRYRERLPQPKLVILGTNDPYWPVDSAAIYLGGLAGRSNLLYLPNSPHSPNDLVRLVSGVVALQRSVAAGRTLPRVEGRHELSGGQALLTVTATGEPRRVRVWFAKSGSREFRAARWQARPAAASGADRWQFRRSLGGDYLASFGEAEFDDSRGRYWLSTPLRIVGPGGVLPLAEDPGVTAD